jgi:hypothetical protein
MKIGDVAGGVNDSGYVQIKIDRKLYQAHRLVFTWMYGETPESHVDHINMIKNDNRLVNLRVATRSENFGNQRAYKSNKSGLKGVHWCNHRKKWVAQIQHNNKSHSLGGYDCPAAASFAYQIAADKLFGAHARPF